MYPVGRFNFYSDSLIDGNTPSNFITGFIDSNGRLHFFVAFKARFFFKNATTVLVWQRVTACRATYTLS
jgi:hypothetical protein